MGAKGCLVAKSGIWGRKGVFGIYMFFRQKSLGGTKQVPRVPFDKYNLMPSRMARVKV